MYTAWTGRKFGVEMEMTEVGLTETSIKQALAFVLGGAAVNSTRAHYYDSTGRTWDVKTDSTAGSREHVAGWEVATPAMTMNEQGHNEELRKGCDAIANLTPRITKRDGLHVTIDVSDYDWEDLQKLMRLWVRYEPFFFDLVAPSRRNNRFCKPSRKITWQATEAVAWRSVQSAVDANGRRDFVRHSRQLDKYYALNISKFWMQQRVEFRLHSGTVDYDKIRHWVILLLALVNRVKQENMPRIQRGKYLDKPLSTRFVAKVLGLAPSKEVPEVNPVSPAIVLWLDERRKFFARKLGHTVPESRNRAAYGIERDNSWIRFDDFGTRTQENQNA